MRHFRTPTRKYYASILTDDGDLAPTPIQTLDRVIGIDRDINAAINIRQQGLLHLRAEGLSVPAS